MIWVSESTANKAAVVPKSTAVAPVKPVPVMVTEVPPAVGPELGRDRDHRRLDDEGELVGREVAEVPPVVGDGDVDRPRRSRRGGGGDRVSESTVTWWPQSCRSGPRWRR